MNTQKQYKIAHFFYRLFGGRLSFGEYVRLKYWGASGEKSD